MDDLVRSYNSKNLLKKIFRGPKTVKRAPLCPFGTPLKKRSYPSGRLAVRGYDSGIGY